MSLGCLSSASRLAVGVAFLLLLLSQGVEANLRLIVTGDDRRVIDLGTFGYDKGGVFTLRVDHFFLDDPTYFAKDGSIAHNESIGFVLQAVPSAITARAQPRFEANKDGSLPCFIDPPMRDPRTRFIFPLNGKTFKDLATTVRAKIAVPALYALFFYNCKGFSQPMKPGQSLPVVGVSFEAWAEEYNLTPTGDKNYLGLGDQPLPVIYALFGVCFVALAILWSRTMRANVTYVNNMHKVMLFLVILKALSLLFESVKYSHYSSTGKGSVWDVFYYIFLTAKGMTLFAVLILLGTGWSILKPFLSENDKRLLMFLVPCQVLVNICLAVIEETNEGSAGWSGWMDLLRLLDVICCCGVLLPIVWSIKNLRDAAELDEKAALSLSRMRMFRTFYIVVVAYIYFTRIVVVMLEGSLPFTLIWTAKFLRETSAVAFYCFAGYKFRPVKENPYVNLNDADLEELKQRRELAGVEMDEIGDGKNAA